MSVKLEELESALILAKNFAILKEACESANKAINNLKSCIYEGAISRDLFLKIIEAQNVIIDLGRNHGELHASNYVKKHIISSNQ